jgi:hypothetical protein
MFSQGFLAAAAALCLLAVIIAEAFKRLFNHPLAKYPGPPLAALTLWYKAYYEIVKDGGWSEHIEKLHNHYGILLIPLSDSAAQWVH